MLSMNIDLLKWTSKMSKTFFVRIMFFAKQHFDLFKAMNQHGGFEALAQTSPDRGHY